MDIDKLIQREAPNTDQHDIAYAKKLKAAYNTHKTFPIKKLLIHQKTAAAIFMERGATHQNTARCVIIYELLKEKTLAARNK